MVVAISNQCPGEVQDLRNTEAKLETRREFAGPWILDRDALAALDKIFDDAETTLKSLIEKDIEAACSAAVKRLSGEPTHKAKDKIERAKERKLLRARIRQREEVVHQDRSLRLFRRPADISVSHNTIEGKPLVVGSFREALAHAESREADFNDFHYAVECGQRKLEVALDSYWATSVRVSATPPNVPEVYDAYSQAEAWAEKYKPPRWVRIWGNSFIPAPLFALGLIAILFAFFQLARSEGNQSLWRTEAESLLKNTPTAETQSQAIRIILALQAGAAHPTYRPIPDRWFYIAIGLSVLLVAFLMFPPKTALALGRGEVLVSRWRRQIRLMPRLFPWFVVPAVIGNAIYDWIKMYF